MTSPGEQKLPLADNWAARRVRRIVALAYAYEAERLLGGAQNIQAAIRDFIPVHIGRTMASASAIQAAADDFFYQQLESIHGNARIRTIIEDRNNPLSAYQFVVEYIDDKGTKHTDWYSFAAITDQEVMNAHTITFPTPQLAASAKAPRNKAARPRRR